MSSIPDELYYEIFLRIPVNSLLVCKSVCKYWYTLISSPSFVKTHTNLNAQRNNFICLTPTYNGNNRRKYAVHSIAYETLSSLSASDKDDADGMLFVGGSIFSSTPYTFIQLLCSCNGLVGLNFFRSTQDKPGICLWNPATREYKKLPKAPTSHTRPCAFDFSQCALGYDSKINDYKFVTLVNSDHRIHHEILVYTLGLNSWKKIQHTSSGRINGRQSGVLYNGAFHWLGARKENYNPCFSCFMISFDISNERPTDIQLPREALDKGSFLCLGVLEAYLCVAHVDYSDELSQVIVWVMQEDGVGTSWSKRYVINHNGNPYEFRRMWYFKNGEILFSDHDKLLSIYDLKHETAREPNHRGLPITGCVSYFETLVSLKSGKYVGGNGEIEFSIEEDEEEDESKKKRMKLCYY